MPRLLFGHQRAPLYFERPRRRLIRQGRQATTRRWPPFHQANVPDFHNKLNTHNPTTAGKTRSPRRTNDHTRGSVAARLNTPLTDRHIPTAPCLLTHADATRSIFLCLSLSPCLCLPQANKKQETRYHVLEYSTWNTIFGSAKCSGGVRVCPSRRGATMRGGAAVVSVCTRG